MALRRSSRKRKQVSETPIDDEAYRRRRSQVKKRRKHGKEQAYQALQAAPYLCELHTHLMGMGNAEFWINEIILNREILPPDGSKTADGRLLLVWNEKSSSFFSSNVTAASFARLLRERFTEEGRIASDQDVAGVEEEQDQRAARCSARERAKEIRVCQPCLATLRREFATLCESLPRSHLERFRFTFDVVFSLEKLAQGLGVTDTYRRAPKSRDMKQMEVEEILGLALLGQVPGPSSEITSEVDNQHFQHYVVWNAREQKFRDVYGIQCSLLRRCLTHDDGQIRSSARARLINAFSMRNADGSDPRAVDFQTSFRGTFTPEFSPRRFALKDCLYEQRLDVLCFLLKHVLNRYQTSRPSVSYVEFSVGVNDLSRPWVLYVLRVYENVRDQLVPLRKTRPSLPDLADLRHFLPRFPHLSSWENRVDYRFLAAFRRDDIEEDIWPALGRDPVSLLNYHPHIAITRMLEEISFSEGSYEHTILFEKAEKKLNALEEGGAPGLDAKMIVGLDLVGDEIGFPYCPFVSKKFIDFVQKRRRMSREDEGGKMRSVHFGVRVHCAENIPVVRSELGTHRAFTAHLYIVLICLRYLVEKLGSNAVRVGHGVGFQALNADIPHGDRKSAVLLRRARDVAMKEVWPRVTFELNPTSNYYLLSTLITGDNSCGSHRSLVKAVRSQRPGPQIGGVVISTDDDGILDIHRCKRGCPGHHSLAAEFCNAIHDGILKSGREVNDRIQQSRQVCFGARRQILATDPTPRGTKSSGLEDMSAGRALIVADSESEEASVSKGVHTAICCYLRGEEPRDLDSNLVFVSRVIYFGLIHPGRTFVRMTPIRLSNPDVVFDFVSSLDSKFPSTRMKNVIEGWVHSPYTGQVVIMAFVSSEVTIQNINAMRNHYGRMSRGIDPPLPPQIHVYIFTNVKMLEAARLTSQPRPSSELQIVVNPGSGDPRCVVLSESGQPQAVPVRAWFYAICPHSRAASSALHHLFQWILPERDPTVLTDDQKPPSCEEFVVPYESFEIQWDGGFEGIVKHWRLEESHGAYQWLKNLREGSVRNEYVYAFGPNRCSLFRDEVDSGLTISQREVGELLRDHQHDRPDVQGRILRRFFNALKQCYLNGFTFHSESFVRIDRPLRESEVQGDCLFPPFPIGPLNRDGAVHPECHIVCRSVRLAPCGGVLPNILSWVLDPISPFPSAEEIVSCLDIINGGTEYLLEDRAFALQCLVSWASKVTWHSYDVFQWEEWLRCVLGPKYAPRAANLPNGRSSVIQEDISRLQPLVGKIDKELRISMYMLVTGTFRKHYWLQDELNNKTAHNALVAALAEPQANTSAPDASERASAYEAFLSAPFLCELHTQLMGMGNAEFWIDDIILNHEMLPSDGSETADGRLLLVWNGSSFFAPEATAAAFQHLKRRCFNRRARALFDADATRADQEERDFYARRPSQEEIEARKDAARTLEADDYEALSIKKQCLHTLIKKFAVFWRSLREEQLESLLLSFDVVFSLEKLAQGLGVTDTYRGKKKSDDTIQVEIEEILGLSCALRESSSGNPSEPQESAFKRYVVWNARKQEFRLVHGIQCSLLRRCLTQDDDDRIRKSAHARVSNSFSMRNVGGSDPRAVDFQTIYRGTFTPEFYPRRFALRDCLYEQRLDVLCCLLKHVLNRYQTSRPPVSYVEFSVGVNDLSTPWVLYVLRVYENVRGSLGPLAEPSGADLVETAGETKTREARENVLGRLQCYDTTWKNRVDYRFLAAFGRQEIEQEIWPAFEECDPVSLLNYHPDIAITRMLEEVSFSKSTNEPTYLFWRAEEQLQRLIDDGGPGLDAKMIVGLDLVGDETGYPYCPFVTKKFIKFVEEQRTALPHFGVRVHCAENIPVVRHDMETYHAFVAHLYIALIGLRHLVNTLGGDAVRIGHGIGFHALRDSSASGNAESSVLLNHVRGIAREVWPHVTFELNPTSNHYLHSPLITGSNSCGSHRGLVDATAERKIGRLVISIDDDGIFPMDSCKRGCFGHHSLAAEFCNAIHDGILKSKGEVRKRIEQSGEACFGVPLQSGPSQPIAQVCEVFSRELPVAASEEDVTAKTISDTIRGMIAGGEPSERLLERGPHNVCKGIFKRLISEGGPRAEYDIVVQREGLLRPETLHRFFSSLESTFPADRIATLLTWGVPLWCRQLVIVAFVSCEVRSEHLAAIRRRRRARENSSLPHTHVYLFTHPDSIGSVAPNAQRAPNNTLQFTIYPGLRDEKCVVPSEFGELRLQAVQTRFHAICYHSRAASSALHHLLEYVHRGAAVSPKERLREPPPQLLPPYVLRVDQPAESDGAYEYLQRPAQRHEESVEDGYMSCLRSNRWRWSLLRHQVESQPMLKPKDLTQLLREWKSLRPKLFESMAQCYRNGFAISGFVRINRCLRESEVVRDCLFPPFPVGELRRDGSVDPQFYIVCRGVYRKNEFFPPDLLQWIFSTNVHPPSVSAIDRVFRLNRYKREDGLAERAFALHCLVQYASKCRTQRCWNTYLLYVLGPYAPANVAKDEPVPQDDVDGLTELLHKVPEHLWKLILERMYNLRTTLTKRRPEEFDESSANRALIAALKTGGNHTAGPG